MWRSGFLRAAAALAGASAPSAAALRVPGRFLPTAISAAAATPLRLQHTPSVASPPHPGNKDFSYSILFSIDSEVGSLQRALKIFKDGHVDLTHIESRPSRIPTRYAFHVQTKEDWSKVQPVVETLKQHMYGVTVLDNNPSTTNPSWFPRKIRDLDVFASRVLGAGAELESDHPGFTDAAYRKRRESFADIAVNYKYGQSIPRVTYTPEEIETWKAVYNKLTQLHETHTCEEYRHIFPLLKENCGYRSDNIPQLEDVSNFLHECTGFRLRPTPGLLSSRDFLAGLAFRVFHSTQYIRHHTKPLYTPEPDVCHELLGHAPLFADKEFAEFSHEVGLASLGASDEDVKKLATCYWFTVEFGLVMEHGKRKAFGAGLLSSFGELQYCLSDEPECRPFEPEVTAVTDYPITTYQPIYYVAESFENMKDKMREFASKIQRPFTPRYNPYTESIEILDNNEKIKSVVKGVFSDLKVLMNALEQRTSPFES
eukprot:m.140169 g.140169  ORF g.140169 m.140169 type:complete len:484 (+) comp20330_c0_seq2:1892-3343(+)